MNTERTGGFYHSSTGIKLMHIFSNLWSILKNSQKNHENSCRTQNIILGGFLNLSDTGVKINIFQLQIYTCKVATLLIIHI